MHDIPWQLYLVLGLQTGCDGDDERDGNGEHNTLLHDVKWCSDGNPMRRLSACLDPVTPSRRLLFAAPGAGYRVHHRRGCISQCIRTITAVVAGEIALSGQLLCGADNFQWEGRRVSFGSHTLSRQCRAISQPRSSSSASTCFQTSMKCRVGQSKTHRGGAPSWRYFAGVGPRSGGLPSRGLATLAPWVRVFEPDRCQCDLSPAGSFVAGKHLKEKARRLQC